MNKQTQGKCKYCGKEYTKAYMLKHMNNCKERKSKLDAEKNSKKSGYFELAVYGRYEKDYWLLIEICEDAALKDLDSFLRDIWVECCGHMSTFLINGINYDAMPFEDSFGEQPAKSMDCKLKTVLQKGMTVTYEYDFGSTTELVIEVYDYTIFNRRRDKITILSRNNPLEFLCGTCHEKKATVICTECFYDGEGFLCDECRKTHECGEEMQLKICNSPRMGVCGYEGSDIYPDQFMPD